MLITTQYFIATFSSKFNWRRQSHLPPFFSSIYLSTILKAFSKKVRNPATSQAKGPANDFKLESDHRMIVMELKFEKKVQ